MAVFDEKWQDAKASITERGIFMLNNDLLSDVSLVVRGSSGEGEPKKSKMAIPAHKFVLSSCSPVFFAMFCGEMAEKSDSIDLPDCEYEGVLEMLRYMYSGKAELNENNVMQVLYVAKKYILPSLAEECIEFLQRNLNTANVFCVLSYAQQYYEKVLVDQCWEMIDRETEEVVKSEEFLAIERSLLEEFVKRESLTIREVELFKAVDLWATKECKRQEVNTDGHMKRKILGERIVKEIRFPVMDVKEFASVVSSSNILTPEEVIHILKYFNSVENSPVAFREDHRIGTNLLCMRFGSVVIDEDDKWYYDIDEKESICFHVDKDIKLQGIRMFGNKNSDYVVILKITDTKNCSERLQSGKYSSVRIQFQSAFYYGFDILFDTPFAVRKGIKYEIETVINGPPSYFGCEGICDVCCHGVKFSFQDLSAERDRGSTGIKSGQIAALLFKPE